MHDLENKRELLPNHNIMKVVNTTYENKRHKMYKTVGGSHVLIIFKSTSATLHNLFGPVADKTNSIPILTVTDGRILINKTISKLFDEVTLIKIMDDFIEYFEEKEKI